MKMSRRSIYIPKAEADKISQAAKTVGLSFNSWVRMKLKMVITEMDSSEPARKARPCKD